MEYKFSIWVHPKEGDDFEITGKATAPSDKALEKALIKIAKKEGSGILDDFTYNII